MSRLVFICPGVLGGVRSYILNLSTFLRSKQVGFSILFYRPVRRLKSRRLTNPAESSVTLEYSAFASAPAVYRQIGACLAPDDILICSDRLELDAINYLQLPNRVVFLMHGDLEHYNSILRQFAPILDKVGCVSEGLRDKYSLVYPSLSFSVCHPLVANFPGARDWASEATPTGVFIGRFEYLKGADTFVKLVKLAADKQLSMRWSVYATSKGSDSALLGELPVEVKINLDASNPDVLAGLEKADWLIFPSRSEGFGIAVLEAMKRGVIPIARPLPIGIPDMVKNGETGFLAETEEEMIAIILGLGSDRQRLEQLRRDVMRFSNDHFDYEKVGWRFVAVMEEVRPGEKQFHRPVIGRMERMLPELIFRPVKLLYNRIKYGNNI